MSKIIQLLEQMGQDAALQHQQAVTEFIEQAELSKELQATLITKDAVLLEQQLNVRTEIFCGIATPEDDEPEKEPDQDDEQADAKAVING